MLIRNARLVAVTEAVPGPVDVRLDDGRVVEVGPSLSGDETSYDAGGRWLPRASTSARRGRVRRR
jgi:imidazolonepropionase-like amidohydrolase